MLRWKSRAKSLERLGIGKWQCWGDSRKRQNAQWPVLITVWGCVAGEAGTGAIKICVASAWLDNDDFAITTFIGGRICVGKPTAKREVGC